MPPRTSVSRRALLMGAGAVAAWAASPARALMAQMGDGGSASSDIDALIARMTVEEKAGQVTLMAAAWAGGAANAHFERAPVVCCCESAPTDVTHRDLVSLCPH